MDRPASTHRRDIYRKLAARNAVVARWRIILPVSGVFILTLMFTQMYLSSLANKFGIGQIELSTDSVTIDMPEYAGVLDDGSSYRVSATTARASTRQADIIDLVGAALSITRKTSSVQANAPLARLDTTSELVIIDGIANVEDTDGTVSKLYRSVFDWAAQTLDSQGPVTVDYADGTRLVADRLHYDTKAMVWTFSNVTVTLESTPGAKKP